MAADVMAENAHLTYKFLSPVRKTFKHLMLKVGTKSKMWKSSSSANKAEFSTLLFIMTGCECAAFFFFSSRVQYLYEFLDAMLTSQTAPEEVTLFFTLIV